MSEPNTENTKDVKAAETKGGASGGRGKVFALAVAIVIVVVLVVAGVLVYVNGRRTSASTAAKSTVTAAQCEANVKAMSAHAATLQTTIESAKEMSSITADEVADPSVLTDLADTLKAAEAVDVSEPACPADGDAEALKTAVDGIRAKSDKIRQSANGLDAAMKVVTASQKAKAGN
ncbi:hypothetical protein G1C96_0014 [Bifidobacterium sp. DSM 109958]|uniref:Colicin transporter n=1 Tax=Bifidobacterium moraviense TaxID=2675323 RepID=A0A7Y0HYK2_9BIFI|nr:hypothetical protein [Bifidobacterium sp. DSM 109958]NMM99437.1 hypothetical protein [Bifidobacterium sp. DSM 109958]